MKRRAHPDVAEIRHWCLISGMRAACVQRAGMPTLLPLRGPLPEPKHAGIGPFPKPAPIGEGLHLRAPGSDRDSRGRISAPQSHRQPPSIRQLAQLPGRTGHTNDQGHLQCPDVTTIHAAAGTRQRLTLRNPKPRTAIPPASHAAASPHPNPTHCATSAPTNCGCRSASNN
jgi:hypothetical protein